ncbi:6-phospho-3-hexuloisomerase [Paenibacillus mendelii]|uniref:6-phospho-3-hexuloisomerase n=1 Tax=Paenibacillus mendelii TaxID=206163 RepID=A0ABV6JJB6_9BACL|nr:6-phospho-3-hexuloisomerase [Paenibacillus mendelii]MCQ6558939.1 6-phospho-3-hexuloisomerase [Paenibacillus mendelii]
MSMTPYTDGILDEINRTVKSVSEAEVELFIHRLLAARSIFVAGAGRSGLMMRAFAMRLMHMGLNAYVVGEAVTPGIKEGDLLIIGSGSGETKSLVGMAEKAKQLGAGVAIITVKPESTIGLLAETIIHIPASPKETADRSGASTVQPMGSLFEQSILLLCDAVVLRAMEIQGIDAASMFGRHANLE